MFQANAVKKFKEHDVNRYQGSRPQSLEMCDGQWAAKMAMWDSAKQPPLAPDIRHEAKYAQCKTTLKYAHFVDVAQIYRPVAMQCHDRRLSEP